MTSSPCVSLHLPPIISQSDRRGESTHPLARLRLRANDFCSAISFACARTCVRACVRVSRLQTERHAGRAQWCHPSSSHLPFLFLLREALCYSRSLFSPVPAFLLWRSKIPPPFLLLLLGPFFVPAVYRCRYYLHDKRPSVAVNAHRVRRAHRVRARSWRKILEPRLRISEFRR